MNFSPFTVDADPEDNEHFVNMYPHASDCLALLVPVSTIRLSFLKSFIQKPAIALIIISLLILMLSRSLRRLEPFGAAVLLTFGAFFAQLKVPTPKRISDHIWTVCILIAAVFTTIILSGSMFELLVNIKYAPEIDTFEHLIASDLVIYAKKTGLDDSYVFKQ